MGINLEEFLSTRKEDESFTGYVSFSKTGEPRFTLVFNDDTYIDIDVENNDCIVSQIFNMSKR